MTEAEQKHALRNLRQDARVLLAAGQLGFFAVVEAQARADERPKGTPRAAAIAAELNLMLAAARDPREAAVDTTRAEWENGKNEDHT